MLYGTSETFSERLNFWTISLWIDLKVFSQQLSKQMYSMCAVFFHDLRSLVGECMCILRSWKMCKHHRILLAFAFHHSLSSTRQMHFFKNILSSSWTKKKSICGQEELIMLYHINATGIVSNWHCAPFFHMCVAWMLSLIVAGSYCSGVETHLLTLVTSCAAVSDDALSIACSKVQRWLIFLATHSPEYSSHLLSHYLRINGRSPILLWGIHFYQIEYEMNIPFLLIQQWAQSYEFATLDWSCSRPGSYWHFSVYLARIGACWDSLLCHLSF